MTCISQPQLIASIARTLAKRFGCKTISQRQLNAIIEAANIIVEAMEKDDTVAPHGAGLHAWLASDDTGLSSKYMARMLGNGPHCDYNYPHDPSDFGRCYRLLQVVPALRERLQDMAATGWQWAAIVKHWAELEALYLEEFPSGNAPKLFKRMDELLREKP